MFNFFKKSEPSKEVLVAETTTKKSYPKVVEDIHNEFFTAGESILQEATCLLKQLEEKDLSKGKRLAALGFGKTREAVVAIETENKLATTKEIAELVMYYQSNYPNNKFITEDQVKQICEKYGLVCGATNLYKGFVPEKKLSLIESFKIKNKDIQKMLFLIIDNKDNHIGRAYYEDLTERGKVYFDSSNLDYSYITTGNGVISNTSYLFCQSFSEKYIGNPYVKAQKIINEGMMICAPQKDMDMTGLKVKGYNLVKEIPDPVVLQPVKGGYLIVAAWGDEASDEIVVNEKLN
jgi:hypothetical protein